MTFTKSFTNSFLIPISIGLAVALSLSLSLSLILFSASYVLGAPPTSPYSPGETLSPSCSVGDANCTVSGPLVSLNGLTTSTQTFATSGPALSISSSGSIHTFTLATSTASQTGVLSSADWTTFNNKAATSTFSATAPIFYNSNTATFSLGITAVSSTRAINTGFALTGGGDLSADRTIYFTGAFNTSGASGLSIASSSGTWTFSIATSSASQSGFLSSTDWTTFNNKQNAITFPLNVASTTANPYYWLNSGSYLYPTSTSWNLGIGTTTPTATLSVVGSSTISNSLNVNSGTLFVDAVTGNVGIGTTGPIYKLDIDGGIVRFDDKAEIDGGNSRDQLTVRNSGTVTRGSAILLKAYNASTVFKNDSIYFNPDSEYIGIGGTYGSDNMVVKTTGNVGIGTTNPNEGKLEVKGGSVCVDTNSDDTASSCIANESDIRLKENIVPITGALETVSKLRGVSFDWKVNDPEVLANYSLISRYASNPHSLGLIAQEVEPIVPEALSLETVGGEAEYLQLDYTRFTPLMIEAIKELKAENETLKARIEVLERQ